MCGRYYVDEETSIEIKKILDDLTSRMATGKGKSNIKTGEIFPTDMAPVLVAENNRIVSEVFKWGVPGFEKGRPLINARSESVFEKKMFRESIVQRRCIIPANGFFEWSHDKQKKKYYFTDDKEEIIYMAGIYNKCEDKDCFVILTTGANNSMSEIHNRMPLLFPGNRMEEWLLDDSITGSLLNHIPQELRKREWDSLFHKQTEFEQLSFDFFKNE